jgi:SpoVK/Ycf46/Vps4 family AAA+-type ATPase
MGRKEVTKIAKKYELAPSFAASAIKVARLMNDSSTIIRTLDSLLAIKNGQLKPEAPEAAKQPFLTSLINADIDLDNLISKITNKGLKKFSMCLYGPSGTGKSEFVRYIAEKMGWDVLKKRVSDIQSMWVGEAEKNIALAFKEAAKENKFLLFDEADGFLHDRSGALRNWEISQVNEMLTWIESHTLPFACTTNFVDKLDQASLRRFTFKINFGYLNYYQVSEAFRYFFGINHEIRMDYLTPADFILAKQKAEMLDITSANGLCELLKKEVEAKGETCSRIGF